MVGKAQPAAITRCTALVPMPSSRAIFKMPSPLERSRWIRFSIAASMPRPAQRYTLLARPRKPGGRADQGSAKKPNFTFDSPSDSSETGVSLAAV
jgi:hypothetical protein